MRLQVQPRPPLQEGRHLREEPRNTPGRDHLHGETGHQPQGRQRALTHIRGPRREATEVLQGRPDEAGGVRIHHELRRRAQGVRDRDGDPRPQADHPQLRPGISPPAAGGQQDGRRSRRSRRRLHQGPGPGQQGDEQRARPHLRRRAPARPGGQRGVAQGQGRRPRLRRRAWTGERRRRREAAAVHPPRHKAPTIHPVEGEDEPRREA